jgi:tetratricopeptide (TPR) repeat protein
VSSEAIRVLLVEDNASDARLLRAALDDSSALDVRFTQVERLGDAVKILGLQRFDVVLLDLSLPDSSGLDTVRYMREKAGGVPIVVLAGLDDEKIAIRAIHEGAQDYLVKGQLEGATLVRSLRYAIEQSKTPPAANEHLAAAVALHVQGQGEVALPHLEQARQAGKNLVEVCSAIAQIHLEHSRYAEAAEAYQELLSHDPDNVAAAFNLALCYEATGAHREAARSFERVLGQAPEMLAARLGLAAAFSRLGEMEAARSAYHECLKLDPQSFEAHFGLGVVFHLSRQYEDAVTAFRLALDLKPDSPEAAGNLAAACEALAYACYQCGLYEEAARHYSEVVRLRPQSFEAWYSLGATRQMLGLHADAVTAYQEAIRLHPGAVEPHINLAIALDELGRDSEAVAAYQAALRLEPRSVTALYNLAIILERAGREDEAAKSYESVLEVQEGFQEASFRLAVLRHRKGALEQAAPLYRRCLQLSPDNPEVLLGLAGVYLESQRLEDARHLYQRLVESRPQPEILFNAGLLEQKAGNLPAAIDLYTRAVSQRSDFAEAWLNLALAYRAAGNLEEAGQCMERAVHLKPELARGYFALPVA